MIIVYKISRFIQNTETPKNKKKYLIHTVYKRHVGFPDELCMDGDTSTSHIFNQGGKDHVSHCQAK